MGVDQQGEKEYLGRDLEVSFMERIRTKENDEGTGVACWSEVAKTFRSNLETWKR